MTSRWERSWGWKVFVVVVLVVNIVMLTFLTIDIVDHYYGPHHPGASNGWYPVGDMKFRVFRADDDRPCIVARRGAAISLWCQPDMPTEGNVGASLRGSV